MTYSCKELLESDMHNYKYSVFMRTDTKECVGMLIAIDASFNNLSFYNFENKIVTVCCNNFDIYFPLFKVIGECTVTVTKIEIDNEFNRNNTFKLT